MAYNPLQAATRLGYTSTANYIAPKHDLVQGLSGGSVFDYTGGDEIDVSGFLDQLTAESPTPEASPLAQYAARDAEYQAQVHYYDTAGGQHLDNAGFALYPHIMPHDMVQADGSPGYQLHPDTTYLATMPFVKDHIGQGGGPHYGSYAPAAFDCAVESTYSDQPYHTLSEQVLDYTSGGYYSQEAQFTQQQYVSPSAATAPLFTGQAPMHSSGQGMSQPTVHTLQPAAAPDGSGINESMLLALESAADRELLVKGMCTVSDLAVAIEAYWPERAQRYAVLRILCTTLAAMKLGRGGQKYTALLSAMGLEVKNKSREWSLLPGPAPPGKLLSLMQDYPDVFAIKITPVQPVITLRADALLMSAKERLVVCADTVWQEAATGGMSSEGSMGPKFAISHIRRLTALELIERGSHARISVVYLAHVLQGRGAWPPGVPGTAVAVLPRTIKLQGILRGDSCHFLLQQVPPPAGCLTGVGGNGSMQELVWYVSLNATALAHTARGEQTVVAADSVGVVSATGICVHPYGDTAASGVDAAAVTDHDIFSPGSSHSAPGNSMTYVPVHKGATSEHARVCACVKRLWRPYLNSPDGRISYNAALILLSSNQQGQHRSDCAPLGSNLANKSMWPAGRIGTQAAHLPASTRLHEFLAQGPNGKYFTFEHVGKALHVMLDVDSLAADAGQQAYEQDDTGAAGSGAGRVSGSGGQTAGSSMAGPGARPLSVNTQSAYLTRNPGTLIRAHIGGRALANAVTEAVWGDDPSPGATLCQAAAKQLATGDMKISALGDYLTKLGVWPPGRPGTLLAAMAPGTQLMGVFAADPEHFTITGRGATAIVAVDMAAVINTAVAKGFVLTPDADALPGMHGAAADSTAGSEALGSSSSSSGGSGVRKLTSSQRRYLSACIDAVLGGDASSRARVRHAGAHALLSFDYQRTEAGAIGTALHARLMWPPSSPRCNLPGIEAGTKIGGVLLQGVGSQHDGTAQAKAAKRVLVGITSGSMLQVQLNVSELMLLAKPLLPKGVPALSGGEMHTLMGVEAEGAGAQAAKPAAVHGGGGGGTTTKQKIMLDAITAAFKFTPSYAAHSTGSSSAPAQPAAAATAPCMAAAEMLLDAPRFRMEANLLATGLRARGSWKPAGSSTLSAPDQLAELLRTEPRFFVITERGKGMPPLVTLNMEKVVAAAGAARSAGHK